MANDVTPRPKQFARELAQVQAQGAACVICGGWITPSLDPGARVMHWHDAQYVERPPVFVTVCSRCATITTEAQRVVLIERLNQLHRQSWEQAHGPEPDNFLLR